jgi:hypothetical protein
MAMSARKIMRTLKSVFVMFTLMSFVAASCEEAPVETDPVDSNTSQIDVFAAAQSSGDLQSPDLDEASGLVASRSNDLYLWTHNDSGGSPSLFLISTVGADSGRFVLSGADNVDWEDIAIGPGPDAGVQYLYVGDIGDNRAVRDNLTIYRLPEPDLNDQNIPATQNLTNIESIDFIYSNGARDAESLMVDPLTNDIYVVSKRESQVGVYVLPFPQATNEMDTAEFLINIPFTMFTAGDISSDGSEILIKNYFNVYYWQRANGQTIAEALAIVPQKIGYTPEPQGEAICFSNKGDGFFTLSEMDSDQPVPILFYRRN